MSVFLKPATASKIQNGRWIIFLIIILLNIPEAGDKLMKLANIYKMLSFCSVVNLHENPHRSGDSHSWDPSSSHGEGWAFRRQLCGEDCQTISSSLPSPSSLSTHIIMITITTVININPFRHHRQLLHLLALVLFILLKPFSSQIGKMKIGLTFSFCALHWKCPNRECGKGYIRKWHTLYLSQTPQTCLCKNFQSGVNFSRLSEKNAYIWLFQRQF